MPLDFSILVLDLAKAVKLGQLQSHQTQLVFEALFDLGEAFLVYATFVLLLFSHLLPLFHHIEDAQLKVRIDLIKCLHLKLAEALDDAFDALDVQSFLV